jgi:hypothetical protein
MKKEITIYDNGASIRTNNKRIVFEEKDGKILIQFSIAGDSEPGKPACRHKCHRGKIRETTIMLSNEGMQSLVYAYLKYRQRFNGDLSRPDTNTTIEI